MVRKHYVEIATIMREVRKEFTQVPDEEVIRTIEDKMAAFFMADNSNFDVVRFFKAAGRKISG